MGFWRYAPYPLTIGPFRGAQLRFLFHVTRMEFPETTRRVRPPGDPATSIWRVTDPGERRYASPAEGTAGLSRMVPATIWYSYRRQSKGPL